MKTIEKELKDYKGCKVYKVYDLLSNGKKVNIVYMANDQEGNNLNCLDSLKDLKSWLDMYI